MEVGKMQHSSDMVERVVFACRQSLQTRMPLHVSRERVDEVARDVGIAALNAALEASHRAVLVEALKPFAAIAEFYGNQEDDAFEVQTDWPHGWPFAKNALALSHFRKARTALASLAKIGGDA